MGSTTDELGKAAARGYPWNRKCSGGGRNCCWGCTKPAPEPVLPPRLWLGPPKCESLASGLELDGWSGYWCRAADEDHTDTELEGVLWYHEAPGA